MKTIYMLLAAGMLLAGCDDPPPPVVEEPQQNLQTITGTVVFRERVGLTPESRLEVVLLDMSQADAPATEVARTDRDNPGQSPIEFTIEYDADLVDEAHTYGIQVEVFDQGHLIMVSHALGSELTSLTGAEVRIYVTRSAQRR